jgi:hypothetical protein
MKTYFYYPPKDSEPAGTPFVIAARPSTCRHGHDELICNADTEEQAIRICARLNDVQELFQALQGVVANFPVGQLRGPKKDFSKMVALAACTTAIHNATN